MATSQPAAAEPLEDGNTVHVAHLNDASICYQLEPSGSATWLCRPCVIPATTSVRDLGNYIDADLSMRTHVATIVSACFAALRQIRSVQRSLSRHALLSLVRALVVSKVDYCNSVLARISGSSHAGYSPS